MVRNIVGTLLEVQSERGSAGRDGADARAARERRLAGATAPAAGLYLWRVEYPADVRRFQRPMPAAVCCR